MRFVNAKLQRIIYSFLCFIFILSPAGTALAQSLGQEDIDSINNDTVWYKADSGQACSSVTTLIGGDNIQKALNFFMGSKGLTIVQAAAIIGNLEQESGQGLNPLAQQNGSSSKVPIPNVGFGIAQWTSAGRQQNLVSFAQQQNGVPGDLSVQLNFLWKELTDSYTTVLQHLKAATTIEDAVNQFMGPDILSDGHSRGGGYENPGDPQLENRIKYASQVKDSYGGSASVGSSGNGGSGCVSSVDCNSGSGSNTAATLSQVRQNAVCIAQQELALWKSQPGYPHPAYANSGYLKYSDGSPEEWCADFVSWIYKQANYPFSGGSSGGWRIAGVSSIQTLGQKEGNFHWHPSSSGYTPKPGDIAIHGANHTNIFISSSGGSTQYIGGDQGDGPYPGGSIVSIESGAGYYGSGITGYVSPD